MSKRETPASAETGLPEVIRRELQVEESWARRTVLADLMNSERLNAYASRRALLWPNHLVNSARI